MAEHDQQESFLFNDGEGLTFQDLNELQRLSERRLMDYVVDPLVLAPGDTVDTWLRVIGPALCPFETGTPDMNVNVQQGTCVRAQTVDPGQPLPHHLLHYLDSTQVIAINAASAFERWDIISASVAYDPLDTGSVDAETRDFEDAVTGALSTVTYDKRRRTKLTLTYTPGTIASTEPSEPSGERRIARIVVPTTTTSIKNESDGTHGYIVDMRYPVSRSEWVPPLTSFWGGAGSTWAVQAAGHLANPAVGHIAYIPLNIQRRMSSHLRLRQLLITSGLGGAPTVEIVRWEATGAGTPTISAVLNITSSITLGGYPQTDLVTVPDAHGAIWHDGEKHPIGDPITGGSHLLLKFTAGAVGDDIGPIAVNYWGD